MTEMSVETDMHRRLFLHILPLAGLGGLLAGCQRSAPAATQTAVAVERLATPPEAWRGRVSDAAWQVLFREATEPPFSSPLDDFWEEGNYLCAACYLPLFRSEDKFNSRTGWPSFTRPIEGHIGTKRDFKLIIPRTEYHCARCGGHQGHVFDDGPPPTGQRWCNNGLALHFVAAGEKLPELRA